MDKSSNCDNPNKCCCGSEAEESQCCMDSSIEIIVSADEKWVSSRVSTPIGDVLQVSTILNIHDKLGAWKVRWGIHRMNYKIDPGLYCVGVADNKSPVFVTGNYKLTFDMLRKELSGINAWILVLDTKGINVWCAAGKGTFGTDELVKRISLAELSEVVSHKTLILPQLGASGVSAHEVQKRSGFRVIYGPVRASDIKEFINNGMKATSEMREVKFTTYDRLVLTPVELVGTFRLTMIIFGVLFILNLFAANPFGTVEFYGYLGALIVGCFFVPVLLPWIPGRAFAWKGWLLGIIWAVLVNTLNGGPFYPEYGLVRALAYMLILPAVSAYYAMNFTGCSTYTSLSGVLKEMKIAIPAIIISIATGGILIILSTFVPGL